jgi:site-specific recombinase XerD
VNQIPLRPYAADDQLNLSWEQTQPSLSVRRSLRDDADRHVTPRDPGLAGFTRGSRLASPVDGPSIADIGIYVEEYLQDCELRLYSPDTVKTRRVFLRNLLWFLDRRAYPGCGEPELRRFFYYLAHGHEEPGGRFGKKELTRAARPVTVADYYHCLHSFFGWLVAQEKLQVSPLSKIAKPQVREETKSPLSTEQIAALLEATKKSARPGRNFAILTFLLDTGCRAGELISIRRKDLDLDNGRCRVLGKGNKYRTVFFGHRTALALALFLNDGKHGEARVADGDPESPLFPPARGQGSFTRAGLRHLVKRLGGAAGFEDEVCVHALRRSFAVQMLRNGANVFSVQAMLGHTNLTQTRKYCQLALADAETQHRQYGPMDRLMAA